jgi:CubicO group peptidase (beta-lactamase class C family)
VATVRITPDSSDVVFRATRTLTAATLAEGGAAVTGHTITWQSSNTAVATVNGSGVVTGVLPGTVTITATSEGVNGTARVRVVAADLSAIIESIRTQYNLPAMGATIVTRDGGVIAIGASGVRRWGDPTPVTVDDKWHLGSDTKAMTAFLAAMTIKAGKLSWGDLMTARYAELAPLVRPEYANLDLRGLATMQSGLVGNPDFTPTGSLAQQRHDVDTWAVQQPPAAPPGTYYYSNIAYQILGEITGRAWGSGYEQAMRDQLWAPLGITTGGFGPTTEAGNTDQPIGHFPNGSGWTVCEACDNSWATGSGKIHMSLRDWSAFIREIMLADAGKSTLLSQSEVRTLTTATTPASDGLSYAYGWLVYTNTGQRIVTHDGTNNRNRARALVYLDAGVAFLLTTNAGDPAEDGGAPNTGMNALVARLQTFWQTGQ